MRRFDRSFLAGEVMRYEVTHGPLSDEAIANLAEDIVRTLKMRGIYSDLCPPPRPAGAPDAEQRTKADAQQA